MREALAKQIGAALGCEEPNFILKNAKVIDVFCHRILECDVAVSGKSVVGLGEYSGTNEVDLGGQYLMPSFIDSHMHIESSMLSPAQYARLAAAKGVTTLIADPHEIANVCGEAGLRYMIDSARSVPIDIYYMLPSSVPATKFDHSGAVIDSIATRRLFASGAFLGLGEMMDYTGVLNRDEEVLTKLGCASLIDGHAPNLTGKELCAYITAGILTDHEVHSAKELLQRVSLGMYVAVREGSQAKNLKELIEGINPHTLRRLMFCTDDLNIHDLALRGSISHCIGKAVRLGADPIDAIIMASLNAAQCYGLSRRGAIAPGYLADFVVSSDITAQEITQVYKGGVLIAKDGQSLFSAPDTADTKKVTGTVHLPPISPKSFELPFTPKLPVIEVAPGTLYTKLVHRKTQKGLNLSGVVERHGGTGNIGLAYIAGFDLRGGAIAQSVGHDSHNITVIGDSAQDMALAVAALGKQGGLSVVRDGKVRATFELPLAGLMSDLSAQDACIQYERFMETLRSLEMNSKIDAFTLLAFLSLLVIPEVKLSDSGVFDVKNMCYLH